MASVFAHGVMAYSLSKVEKTPFSVTVLISGITLSVIPDLDVLAFVAGIPYESVWGHRGFTHSILFAVLAASITTYILSVKGPDKGSRATSTFIYLFLCTVSHGFLDAMTTGGRGVGFFIPFTPNRYFFDHRPILVSPIGIESFFSSWGLAVIKSEIKFIGIPALIIVITGYIRRRIAGSTT